MTKKTKDEPTFAFTFTKHAVLQLFLGAAWAGIWCADDGLPLNVLSPPFLWRYAFLNLAWLVFALICYRLTPKK